MSEQDLTELSQQVAAHPRWKWAAGMKILNNFRVVESLLPMMFPVDTPDLLDPATGGAMLTLLGDARTRISFDPDGYLADGRLCETLAEACARIIVDLPAER